MRENSRRSTPRPARPGTRAWSAREVRGRTSGAAGSGPGVGRSGYGGGRPGPQVPPGTRAPDRQAVRNFTPSTTCDGGITAPLAVSPVSSSPTSG